MPFVFPHLPPWLIKIIALGAVLGLLWGIHTYDKHSAVKEAVTNTELRIEKQARENADEISSLLKKDSAKAQGIKNEKIKSLTRERDNLLNSLRERPSRDSDSTAPGNSCPATGAQLYKEDGEFLAREAARADRIKEERDYYYLEYENARKQLEKAKNGNR